MVGASLRWESEQEHLCLGAFSPGGVFPGLVHMFGGGGGEGGVWSAGDPSSLMGR